MHKTLHSIQLIRDYMEAKNLIKYPISNIDDIYKFFIYITNNENKYKFNSLYIFNYIEQYIVNEEDWYKYSKGSNQKVYIKCPYCKTEKYYKV